MPLCNASWGLGVCSVLVRSVSPCKLVLEVRLFPSLPCAVLSVGPSLVSAFFFLLPFRVGPVPAGCACETSEQMQNFFLTGCHWLRGGAVNLIPSTAQRRRWFEIVISGLIIPTYLQSVSISGHGMWLTQEPQPYINNLV